MSIDAPRNRLTVVGIVAVSLFTALFARLWFLQVVTAPEYQVAAENNRIRIVQQEAPRGRILDRTGKHVLVDNRRAIVVAVDWQRYDKLDQSDQNSLLARLAGVLTRDQLRRTAGELASVDPGGSGPSASGAVAGPRPTPMPFTVERLKERLADPRFSHFKPVPVATDVSEDLEVHLAEQAEDYETVAAERMTVRHYPYGQLLAHVLGYVGAIGSDELSRFQNDVKPYERDDEIGRTGIERAMERQLRGTPGLVRYEVDARNRPVREVPGGRRPVPGDDVYLTVDLNLQYLTEKALATQIKATNLVPCRPDGCPRPKSGSAVVLEPGSGQVLAMASYPTYSPGDFVGGISTEEYAALVSAAASVPAENKAIAGQYAPGSTWKLFSAYAGLTSGQIRPDDVVSDPGYYAIPNCGAGNCQRQNARREAHGRVNLSRAITVSSDVYFYKLGDEMWRRRQSIGDDALARSYRQWGFGIRSALGLVGEAPGRVPDPRWKREFAKNLYPTDPEKVAANGSWFTGDNMNAAVGQGDVLVTPLQLANGYATFANGGTLLVPQFVLQVNQGYSASVRSTFSSKVVRKVGLPPEWRLPMVQGFMGVTVNGTAARTFAGFPQDRLSVAGKTGTAQVTGKSDTSLFAAFAPAAEPRFAAAAIIPEAGFGGDAAAPLIRRMLEPIALGDGTLASLPETPLGGAFDVDAELAALNAPLSGARD